MLNQFTPLYSHKYFILGKISKKIQKFGILPEWIRFYTSAASAASDKYHVWTLLKHLPAQVGDWGSDRVDFNEEHHTLRSRLKVDFAMLIWFHKSDAT